jgi:hypothetical protein
LKPRILHTGHLLGARKVPFRRIAPFLPLAGIVDQVLGNFPQRPALLAVVDDNTTSPALCGPDALFNRVRQVRPTRAYVGTEHIGSVALVVDATGEFNILVGNCRGVTPNIYGQSANGRQEHLDIGSRNKFRVHAIGHPEDRMAQIRFGRLEATSNFWHVPDRFNGGLGDNRLSSFHQYLAIRHKSAGCNSLPALGQVNVRLCDGDRGTDVPPLLQPITVMFRDQMSERVHGSDLLRVGPGWVGSDLEDRTCEGKIRDVVGIELVGGHSKTGVDAVAPLMGPDRVSLCRMSNGADDGAPNARIGMGPANGDRVNPKRVRMGRQDDVIGLGDFGKGDAVFFCLLCRCRHRLVMPFSS